LFSVGLRGFVGFVVNLLNRPTDGAMVHGQKSPSEKVRPKKRVRKSAYEKELLLVRMGVRKITFSLRVPKKNLSNQQ
jgi:hypothetical protein